jgi:MFS family permease
MSPTLAIAPKQPARTGWALLLTSVAFFMVTLDTLVVITALPAIHRELGGQVSTLEWAVNAYPLVFAAGIITAASTGGRLGRRRVYVAGLALVSLASAACALPPSTTLLIAARATQGLGAAIVTPLSLTILTTAFGPERRGRVIGIWGSIAGPAVAAGLLVGGGVTQGLSWHLVFWVNVPIGLAGAALSRLRLPEAAASGAALDLAGAVSASLGALAVIWSLVESGGTNWDATNLGLMAGGLLVLAAFLAWERRAVLCNLRVWPSERHPS